MITILVVISLMVVAAAGGAYGSYSYLRTRLDAGRSASAATLARLDAIRAAHRIETAAWDTERQMYEIALDADEDG